MPSWFTGNSGGAVPPMPQIGMGGAASGMTNEYQTHSIDPKNSSDLFSTLPGPTGGRPMGPPGQGGASIGLDLQSIPWAGGMMMGPDGQANAGVMEGGQVMPQTLFSM